MIKKITKFFIVKFFGLIITPFSKGIFVLIFKTIIYIDNLELPIMQKHHVRILAHCLQILKIIGIDNSFEYQNKNPLREWCDNQSQKFDDKKFSDLFYQQLESASKKLSTFSKK